MTFQLRIFPAADIDVDETAHFIAADNLIAALRFYDSVESTYSRIRDHPIPKPRYERNHPRFASLRRRSVVKFPKYLVFYSVEGAIVEVIRVLHSARDTPAILLAAFTSE